ncbi:MAG TPA: hypothetical protein VGM56_19115 [Byssovorax sp.]
MLDASLASRASCYGPRMIEHAIGRILHHVATKRGGDAVRAADGSFRVEILEDLEREDAAKLAFTDRFVVADGRVTEITCDAPIAKYTLEQSAVVAGFQREVTEALARELVTFAAFADVQRFLEDALDAESEGDMTTIFLGDRAHDGGEVDDEPMTVMASCIDVAGEPWISLSTPFVDDVDPEWLLEKNGELTHVHFESFEGSPSLAAATPLAITTGQRLVELVHDLATTADFLVEELLDGGGEPVSDEFPA